MNAANAGVLIPAAIPPHPLSPNDTWLSVFPLRTFLELGACDYSPGTAREHVSDLLEAWYLHPLTEPVHLVLSELLTNAITAIGKAAWEAEPPPVRLWVLGGPGTSGDGEVMLLIWDAIAELPPEPRLAGELEESGRGLWIARAYSTRLDFYLPAWQHGGKVARALIDQPAPVEGELVVFHPGAEPPGGY